MIAFVRGPIASLEPTHVVVDCGGVGYRCRISLQTYETIRHGKDVLLHTFHQVKEDSQTLFGFADPSELQAFELLINVQGVGGATALLLLSSLAPNELQTAIARQDVALLKKVKGVGQRTAERLVVELKDRVSVSAGPTVAGIAAAGIKMPKSAKEEALQALATLGFARSAVEAKVDALLATTPAADTGSIIKGVLRG